MCRYRNPEKIRVVVVTTDNRNPPKYYPALRAALGEDWDEQTTIYHGLRHLGGLIMPAQEPEPFRCLELLVVDASVDGDYGLDHFFEDVPEIGRKSRPRLIFVDFPSERIEDVCLRHKRAATPISSRALFRLVEFLDKSERPLTAAAAA